MSRVASPIVRRRRLGAELRRLREVSGLTGDQVVDQIGWLAKSKLSRLENGRSRPDLADVLDLLDLYRVSGRDRDQLVAIARDAGNTRGWLRAYPVMTARQRGYAELEAGSAEIWEYAANIIPGLLQTPEYARDRILSARVLAPDAAADDASEPDLEVAARLARQGILTRPADAPQYEAVLEEQMLLGRGIPVALRGAQLARLYELTSLPNVTIRVLPSDMAIGPGFVPSTGFSIYHFADPGDPDTVAVETMARELVLSEPVAVQRHGQVFGWLRDAALSPDGSVAWLADRLH